MIWMVGLPYSEITLSNRWPTEYGLGTLENCWVVLVLNLNLLVHRVISTRYKRLSRLKLHRIHLPYWTGGWYVLHIRKMLIIYFILHISKVFCNVKSHSEHTSGLSNHLELTKNTFSKLIIIRVMNMLLFFCKTYQPPVRYGRCILWSFNLDNRF